nr:MAG TPA: hypothetical protein [Caudoviricetes sp.]
MWRIVGQVRLYAGAWKRHKRDGGKKKAKEKRRLRFTGAFQND